MSAPPLRPARPRPHSLADLAVLLHVPAPGRSIPVTGVTHASGSVRRGDLYVALAGMRTHGARYTAEAVAAGAVAVLTDPDGRAAAEAAGVPVLVVDAPRSVLGRVAAWVHDAPTSQMTLLGVTGTNGKTTTAYLIEAGLRAAGHRTGLVGTIETRIGDRAVPSVRTTPEATDLQATFAAMVEQGVTAAAMEVSSHALALDRVDAVRFVAGAFTNLSQDHLDFHPDMEAYFAAKATLFDGRCEYEVVNLDDPWGHRLVRPGTVTVSADGDPRATWRAVAVTERGGTSSFRAVGPNRLDLPVRVRMPGGFNVANALLALAMLTSVGVDPAAAAAGISGVSVPGRMERVDVGQPFLAVVDYAHTPEAVGTALAALRPMTTGRLVVVLGCGGDRDRAKRPLMGQVAGRGADLVVVTDDNPRSEDAATIRAAMIEGIRRVSGAEWVEVGGRRDAIARAVRGAGPGDTVLVAGKGHESGQEIGAMVHPFDDRMVLREAIQSVLA
ncbi:MAG TPA: UDP-N-acetylmuramoyl-L-alanyl-D-glutamate--2,6-diaminopimelate ligase [Mycobacteriales bacterium]|nr:UDP-N-acetylmuramoyl-L-alanyl-D-glutamate--2,6-diaminopimelate ligase [Mycobacteriales bacterium]